MPTDWVLYHFMYDLNILKPLACFHYVVYFYKRVLFCVFIIRYMNDAFTMLTLLLLLNLFSFLWACLVRPFKTTINNRINIWMEFCMIVLSILMFPFAYKWTSFKDSKIYAQAHFIMIFVMLVVMMLMLFFNHCWRVMVEKKEFNDPGVPIYTQVEQVK